MIWALACHHLVPGDTAETDCDGVDDDADGTVDDGAARGWGHDPGRWDEVAVLEDPTAARFAAALAASDRVWIAASELTADYSDGAVVIYEVVDGRLEERARIEDEVAVPFVYTGAVDPSGDFWVAGAWYVASTNERRLLVYRYGEELASVVTDDPDVTDERPTEMVATAGGVWVAGRASTGARLWRVDGELESTALDVGSADTLVADGDSVRVGGSLDAGGYVATIDPFSIVRTTEEPVEDVAGGGFYTTASGLWQDATLVDEAAGASYGHVVRNGHSWVAGSIAEGLPMVRSGTPEFGASWEGDTPGEVHLLAVDGRGGVWATTSEQPADGSAPLRSRILHLWCR